MTTEFKVPDASCGHCKGKIESAVGKLGGVTAADLDIDTKRLTIEHDGTMTSLSLAAAITDIGYTPEPAA